MEDEMKKLLVYFCAGVLMLGLTACGGNGDGSSSGQGGSSVSGSEGNSSVPGAGEGSTAVPDGAGEGGTSASDSSAGQTGGAGAGDLGSEGWSEEMEGLKAAVKDVLGENYWPSMALDAEMMEMYVGLSPDLYEDYLAEMPMISANVDTLIIVKAKEGQADAVEEVLNSYREAKISDTMQYPMNIGKIQASRVDKIGDYVLFIQLGADTTEALDKGDEAVIAQCQEANEQAAAAVKQKLGL